MSFSLSLILFTSFNLSALPLPSLSHTHVAYTQFGGPLWQQVRGKYVPAVEGKEEGVWGATFSSACNLP
jgi:hypothetical protein